MNPFVSRKEIRFHHCDPAGIVFYPQYFVLFHELLEDWFNLGLAVPYADFIGRQRLGIPTVHVSCDFIAASRLGDQIDLTLTVAQLGRTSIDLTLQALHDGEARVRIRQVVVLTALDQLRPVPIPDALRTRMDAYRSTEASNPPPALS